MKSLVHFHLKLPRTLVKQTRFTSYNQTGPYHLQPDEGGRVCSSSSRWRDRSPASKHKRTVYTFSAAHITPAGKGLTSDFRHKNKTSQDEAVDFTSFIDRNPNVRLGSATCLDVTRDKKSSCSCVFLPAHNNPELRLPQTITLIVD